MRTVILATTLALASAAAAAAPIADTDRTFLTSEVQGATYEVGIAKLATQKATKPQIRAYSKKIVADHSTANPELMRLAKSKSVTAPTGMSTADSARYEILKGDSGTAFDKAYVDEITRINSDDKDSFKKEMSATKDPQIKAYVAKFTRMDAMHAKMGEALKPMVR